MIDHPYAQTHGTNLIVIGYQKVGHKLGATGNIVTAFPLYDIRDFNYDGKAGFLEKAFASGWYDPYETFSLLEPAADADWKVAAGNAVKDYKFVNDAKSGFLKHAFKASARAAITLTVERILTPGVEKTLAVTRLKDMEAAGTVIEFVVKTVMETVVMEAVSATHVRA